ncbi:MAG: NUDIX hydrolase, partial [Propionibacterium sp.]|nr:NUDIX hydrolase [Propionibacterium sp.]
PVGLTASEQQRLLGHRWFSVRQLPEPLWPATLGDLLRWESGPPLQLGDMDESTVP